MSNLPPPFVPKGGFRPRGPRGGPRGGARGGLRGGPRGGAFNNQHPRGGYMGNQGFAPNTYSQQQQHQMPQSGFYDPFGNWIPNQAFHPYNHNNAFQQPHVRNNQWRNDQGSDGSADQSDEAGASLAGLKTKYNKTQGQLLAMKDEKDVLEKENGNLVRENAELRETSNSLIKNVQDFGQMMKELEARNKLLKTQLDKVRGNEPSVEEDGLEQREFVTTDDDFDRSKIEGGEKDEGSAKPVSTKHRAKGALKNPSEAMKALVEAGDKKATKAESNEGDEADITETEMVGEVLAQEEKASDYTLVDPNPEDEIDWDFEDLDGTEEAVVQEAKVVEVKAAKRKVSEDGEANVTQKKRKVSVDGKANVAEKRSKRARNRK